jgi:hypothetical protein
MKCRLRVGISALPLTSWCCIHEFAKRTVPGWTLLKWMLFVAFVTSSLGAKSNSIIALFIRVSW